MVRASLAAAGAALLGAAGVGAVAPTRQVREAPGVACEMPKRGLASLAGCLAALACLAERGIGSRGGETCTTC